MDYVEFFKVMDRISKDRDKLKMAEQMAERTDKSGKFLKINAIWTLILIFINNPG